MAHSKTAVALFNSLQVAAAPVVDALADELLAYQNGGGGYDAVTWTAARNMLEAFRAFCIATQACQNKDLPAAASVQALASVPNTEKTRNLYSTLGTNFTGAANFMEALALEVPCANIQVYAYGSFTSSGHFWHPRSQDRRLHPINVVMFKYMIERTYDEVDRQVLGHAYRIVTELEGTPWTCVSWWDRTFDRRFGSYLMFTMPGRWSFDGVVSAANRQWPNLFEKIAGRYTILHITSSLMLPPVTR